MNKSKVVRFLAHPVDPHLYIYLCIFNYIRFQMSYISIYVFFINAWSI